MKIKEIILQKKAPCGKCPYKLGLIETLTNPCPQCKQDGYSSYEWFQKKGTAYRIMHRFNDIFLI